MLKKPSFLLFFSLFLIFEPLITVAFISMEKDFAFTHVLTRSINLSPIEVFNFWVIFPVSGVLLLSIRSYSYLLFILLQVYNVIFHLNYESYTWPYLSDTPSPSAILLLVINFFIVIYLLMPDIRKAFFDRNLRWWERSGRFNIDEACFITFGSEVIKALLIDFSETGALIGLKEKNLAPGQVIKVDFQLLNKDYDLNATVIRKLEDSDGMNRFGLEFKFKNIFQRYSVKFLRASISKSPEYRQSRL